MKTYYRISRAGNMSPDRYETLEQAVDAAKKDCENNHDLQYEILQCVAITSASKPVVSTFYMDGVNVREPVLQLPKGLPPLPTVPVGYDRWEYRGMGWESDDFKKYAIYNTTLGFVWNETFDTPYGNSYCHYVEAVKD